MNETILPGDTRVDVDGDGALILTISSEDLLVCARCPNLHVRLRGLGTPARIRLFALGLFHLADHVEEEAADA
jgi:hypothetical protein